MSLNDVEAKRIASLEARVSRMETMMRELLSILSTSATEYQRVSRMQVLAQELHNSQGAHASGTTGMNPGMPQQERPELAAIRQALLAGDKMQAIKLYRNIYGVGLKEAQDAINAM